MSQSIAFYGICFPSYVRRRLISAHSQWGKSDCPGSLRKKTTYCCVNAAVVMRGHADLSAYRLSARAGCFFSFIFSFFFFSFFFFPRFFGGEEGVELAQHLHTCQCLLEWKPNGDHMLSCWHQQERPSLELAISLAPTFEPFAESPLLCVGSWPRVCVCEWLRCVAIWI